MFNRKVFVPIALLIIVSMILAAAMDTGTSLAKPVPTKVGSPDDEIVGPTASPIISPDDRPIPGSSANSLAGVDYYFHNYGKEDDINLPDLKLPEGQRGWNIAIVNSVIPETDCDSRAMGPALTAQIDGLVNIVRIDYKQENGQNIAVPRYSKGEDYDGWIRAFADCVYRFRHYQPDAGKPKTYDLAHIFIVGNEPDKDGNVSPDEYSKAFNALWYARLEVHPPDSDTQLLAAGPSAFSPDVDPIQWMTDMTQGLTDMDGFAIHTYAIRDGCTDPQQPCKWDGGGKWKYDGGFRFYRDLIEKGINKARWNKPVYITEFDTSPGPGTTPNDNYIAGWIQKAFSDVRDYNANRKDAPEVKALNWFVDKVSGWEDFSLQVGFENPVTHWRLAQAYNDMQTEFHNPANRGLLSAVIDENGSTIPLKMLPGETRRVTVRVVNTGLTVWQARSNLPLTSGVAYGLAATSNNQMILSNPECGSTKYNDVTVFNICKNVPFLGVYDFSFDIKMPLNTGTEASNPAKLELQMANVSGRYLFWFGELQSWQIAKDTNRPGYPLAAGESHTCALTGSAKVMCWGNNWYGQLGNGTTQASPIPVDVTGLGNGVTGITAGDYHTCALASSGGVKCWGENYNGQLGDGTTQDSSTPVDVTGLGGEVVAIAAGLSHTCALTSYGGVKCWGENYNGQLGNGTTQDSSTPVDVTGLGNEVVAITAGRFHTCALTSSGGVRCWGFNGYGQLGDGTIQGRLTPVDVTGLGSSVTGIAAGSYHTCALTNSGGVRCWGYNYDGQLGDGTTQDSLTPMDVTGLGSRVTKVTANDEHTCALISSGGVKCWGDNYNGQLGDGTTVDRSTPVDVIDLSSESVAIAAGGSHTCVLTSSGGVKCWGYNAHGQLGDGTAVNRWTPVDVIGLP